MPWAWLALASLLASCSDHEPGLGDDCFPIDPWTDERAAAAEYAQSEGFRPAEYDQMIRAIGFCEYSPEDFAKIFPGYNAVDLDRAYYCIEGSDCEQCPGEEVEDGIRANYSSWQDMVGCLVDARAVIEYERGCVTFADETNGGPRCCYSAAIVSECPVRSGPMI